MQLTAKSICEAHKTAWNRPFGQWHYQSIATRLCDNHDSLRRSGIKIEKLATYHKDFQKQARVEIARTLRPYDLEERLRSKIKRWHFADPPRHVAARIRDNLKAFANVLPPAVIASYLRALWNGIPTSRRMSSVQNFVTRNCVFECSATAQDSIEHYCYCSALQTALANIPEIRRKGMRPANISNFFVI